MVNGTVADLRDAVVVELEGIASFWCHRCGLLDNCEHTEAAGRALDPDF
jgi:hypothetical protein